MSDNSATIQLQKGLSSALIQMGYAESDAALATFVGVISGMTNAKISRRTFTVGTDMGGSETSGNLEVLEFAAHFKLRRTDPNADVKFASFRLPAPKISMFDHIEGVGYRIKKADGDTLAAAFSAVTGEDFVFDSGWLVK